MLIDAINLLLQLLLSEDPRVADASRRNDLIRLGYLYGMVMRPSCCSSLPYID